MARYEKNTPRKTEGVFAYPEYKKPVGRLSLGEVWLTLAELRQPQMPHAECQEISSFSA